MYLSAEAVFILIKHNSHFMRRASKQLALAERKGRADVHLVMDYLLYPAGGRTDLRRLFRSEPMQSEC